MVVAVVTTSHHAVVEVPGGTAPPAATREAAAVMAVAVKEVAGDHRTSPAGEVSRAPGVARVVSGVDNSNRLHTTRYVHTF